MISVFVSLSGQQGLSGARLGDQGTTAQKKCKTILQLLLLISNKVGL
jgi:hypothetical protein